MSVILDDDVLLILTLDEELSAPLTPSNGLGQEDLPSKMGAAKAAPTPKFPVWSLEPTVPPPVPPDTTGR